MRIHRLLTTAILTAWLVPSVPARPLAAAGPVVTGGGLVHVTDLDGNAFPLAGEFVVAGGLTPSGSAHGRVTFVFRGAFAAYWGAVPDVTDWFRLNGKITDVAVNGNTVTLSGTLTETDYGVSNGVVFVEENVPFQITIERGATTFVFQFCELPPFALDVASGRLAVH